MKSNRYACFIVGLGLLFCVIFAFVLQNIALALFSLFLSLLLGLFLLAIQEILGKVQEKSQSNTGQRTSLLDKSEHWYQQKLGEDMPKETQKLEEHKEDTENIEMVEQKELLCSVCSTKNTADRSACWMCGSSLQKE